MMVVILVTKWKKKKKDFASFQKQHLTQKQIAAETSGYFTYFCLKWILNEL